jgi:hypothetical protein
LRDQCAVACLTRIEHIVSAYDDAPVLLEREAIDDRAVDLWSPLVAIAFVADIEDSGNRTRDLLDLARDLGTVRDADNEAGSTARLLEALEAIRAQLGEAPTPGAVLEALRARAGWDWVKSTRRLAGLLNPLGIARRQIRDGGRRRWCYVLDADQLADLQARYGPRVDTSDELNAVNAVTDSRFSVSDPVTTGASGDNPHE